MTHLKIFAVLLFACNAQFILSSYLRYPRIHFAGQFRVDSNTRNNDRCNYRKNKQLNSDLNSDWNFNGTQEFLFFNTKVTSVVYQDGTTSESDTIVGRSIVDNLDRPFAKLNDLDVDIQDHPTVYGMNFGITWDKHDSQNLAFYGQWTRNVIAQCMWPRMKCYSPESAGTELFQDSFPLAGQSTTRITNIDWNDVGSSRALAELRSAANGGDLTVRTSVFYYAKNYPPYVAFNATLGYVVGVIGIPGPRDTLNVPGQRAMAFKNFPIGLMFDENDLCHGFENNIEQFGPWMYTAPFEVDENAALILLDLSSSIPSQLDNSLRNIGNLRVGVLMDGGCVMLLWEENLPYDDTDALPIHSGIFEIPIESPIFETLESRPVVMGQYFDNTDGATPICGEFLSIDSPHSMNIILQESEYFIRPNGYYVDRLDRVEKPSTPMSIYVTRYGQPASGVSVQVQSGGTFLPENGIVASSSSAITNSDGIATFQFELREDVTIPVEREYETSQCSGAMDPSDELTLPIEGQVYTFTFCVDVGGKCDVTDINLAFLAFSDAEYVDQPNWVDDVEPILAQFARLTPIMKTILDMGSYEEVNKPHNIELMRKTLLLDFEDPSYMPTTRDLSPVKRKMILRWLDNPIYDSSGKVPIVEKPTCAPPVLSASIKPMSDNTPIPLERCVTSLKFNEHPGVVDPYFSRVQAPSTDQIKSVPRDRPLFGLALRNNPSAQNALNFKVACSLDNLKWQLQTAIQLEWSTLPTYLTSLYSIVDGCNTEIYNIIRSVIMQKMFRFTQAANILIAVNGSPLIDDANVTASYPTHLPGQVLPHLTISLKKVSLEHVHDVFMGIESAYKPDIGGALDTNLYTKSAFYEEISLCIEELGDDVFDPTTLDKQVQWPWNPTSHIGQVVNVTDARSAVEAINRIVAQGEREGLLEPTDIDSNSLAHFFHFEEIFCQRHLKKESDDLYSYSGAPIPFNKEGVWPMRDNPKTSDVLPNTNCYTESKVFHQVYRNLLKKLQAVFNGSPGEIFDAVSIMESLQVHAKRLMWTKFNPDNPTDATTCGPVWDYIWFNED